MKTANMLLRLVASLTFLVGAAQAYERLQGPTELLYWDKTNAYNGYTLFGTHGTTYLIGHFFEVTADGRLVWEYINPVTKVFGTVKILMDALPMVNSAFRAYRYGADHPALKGKDLKPLGTITDAFPRQPDTRAKNRPPQGQGGQGQGGQKKGKDGGRGQGGGVRGGGQTQRNQPVQ